MKKTGTTAWDAATHLESVEDMAAYLEAAFEDGDPALIAAALGDVARAQGMTQVARDAGLGRESLYKVLSSDGNPGPAELVVQGIEEAGVGPVRSSPTRRSCGKTSGPQTNPERQIQEPC